MAPRHLLVSSYTKKHGHVESKAVPQPVGLSVFEWQKEDSAFGALRLRSQVKEEGGPDLSYICANRAGNRIYAVNESYEEGCNLVAFAFDAESGELTVLNKADTGGDAACHLMLSPDEKLLAVANYQGGSVAMFSIENGAIGERIAFQKQEASSGVNAERQDAPHAHMAVFDSTGAKLLVPDLGADQVLVFEASSLKPLVPMSLPPGSGPRHLVLHPQCNFVYVVNELLSTISACTYHDGVLRPLADPVSTLPPDVKVGVGGQSFCAAIKISSDGRFLYASNRGHDSISTLLVAQDGTVRLHSHEPCWPMEAGSEAVLKASWPPRHTPRDFMLCGPQDEWLIAACQDSDGIAVLSRNPANGALSPTGVCASCAAPVCLLLL